MKKMFFLVLLLIATRTSHAQITYEQTYPNGSQFAGNLHPVQLTGVGYVYCLYDIAQLQIRLYNLNHSLYTTINIPALPANAASIRISYVSNTLFDMNSTNMEYIIQYTAPVTNNSNRVCVYRDNGTLLFQKDSVFLDPAYYTETPSAIFSTPSGTKMILSSQFGPAYVYALAGTLPCYACSPTPPLSDGPDGENPHRSALPFPNPSSETTTVPYQLPEGEHSGWLVVYDQLGQEVKRFQVTDQFDSLLVGTADLAVGTYNYRIEANGKTVQGRQLIVIH